MTFVWSELLVCIFGLLCVSQYPLVFGVYLSVNPSLVCPHLFIHSFIHLFIPKIYIAPFHGFYSEMLLVLLSIQHSHYLPVVSPSSKSCMEWIFFNQLHSFLMAISSVNMLVRK